MTLGYLGEVGELKKVFGLQVFEFQVFGQKRKGKLVANGSRRIRNLPNNHKRLWFGLWRKQVRDAEKKLH